MTTKLPPWHEVVKLRDDVRSGELSLAEFAADLQDVMLGAGKRPVYEDPARFFALTYPTLPLRELARDVAMRLAGRNTKAIRHLEITYGGGKTHTLVTLRHLAHDPDALPDLPAVREFRTHAGALSKARVAALCFDKIDDAKGVETRGPAGEARWFKRPWSVLAYQIAGDAGLRALHPDGAAEERDTPPAEPLLADLLEMPQSRDLGTLILIDETLMYAHGLEERAFARLKNFFQYLCQATARVDRCAMVVSLLASKPEKSDKHGRERTLGLFDVFNRQREEGIQPVQRQDVAEVLRRRFFTPESIANPESFRPSASGAVTRIARLVETMRKDRANAEERFLREYPFHPDLTDIFYARWGRLDGFQRTRGILRAFASALRDAEKWDAAPLVGPGVFLPAPGETDLAKAVRELAGFATRGSGKDWIPVLKGELDKARTIQREHPQLKSREMEQAVCAVFLGSQPINQKLRAPELMTLLGANDTDDIQLDQALHRWTEVSWFLDETEFPDSGANTLPGAWRLGDQPNLAQMHHDARSGVQKATIEDALLKAVQTTKSLIQGAKSAGATVHLLPQKPHEIADDGAFHFAVLGPKAASESGKPSSTAQRFLEETTGPNRPRAHRNAVVLAAPLRQELDYARERIRDHLGWEKVRSDLEGKTIEPQREAMLSANTERARTRITDAIREAWSIVVAVGETGAVQAFKVRPGEQPLFAAIQAHEKSRIKDAAINAEALTPSGPYNLWRPNEASRLVKDLVGAFSQDPKLPKMLRPGDILNTIDQGVRDGHFVASLARPDNSTRTWWRQPIDETARPEPALELFLPGRATLAELAPTLLRPGALPELWNQDAIRVADVLAYFAGGRTAPAEHGETLDIPICPPEAVEAAIAQAVEQGILWLVQGPSSFQEESLPPGVLTPTAELRKPMAPFEGRQLTAEELPRAWENGRTTALSLLSALSEQGVPVPWPVVRESIAVAIRTRWMELAPDSAPWPCDHAGARDVILKAPERQPLPGNVPFSSSADLAVHEVQDVAETLEEVVKVVAGSPLQLQLRITLGGETPVEKVSEVNRLLGEIKADLRLSK